MEESRILNTDEHLETENARDEHLKEVTENIEYEDNDASHADKTDIDEEEVCVIHDVPVSTISNEIEELSEIQSKEDNPIELEKHPDSVIRADSHANLSSQDRESIKNFVDQKNKTESNELQNLKESDLKNECPKENSSEKQFDIAQTIEKIISDIDETIKIEEQDEQLKSNEKIEFENEIIVGDLINESQITNENSKVDEEKLLLYKQQEMELLRKNEELTFQIQQQEILAKKLKEENERIKNSIMQNINGKSIESENIASNIDQDTKKQFKHETIPAKLTQESNFNEPNGNIRSHLGGIDHNMNQSHESGAPTIDLNKIFTPATDQIELPSKNRKIFASSAFYSCHMHPTVQDQLELARKISDSLSDSCNQSSKGQSMYVNRKKRSTKWIHEGGTEEKEDVEKINNSCEKPMKKSLLQLVMNPRGQMIDYMSAGENLLLNTETGLLSPKKCAELAKALQTQQGKGAELFANRRKKVEKWIKDHYYSTSKTTSEFPDSSASQTKFRNSIDDTFSPASSVSYNIFPNANQIEHTKEAKMTLSKPGEHMQKQPLYLETHNPKVNENDQFGTIKNLYEKQNNHQSFSVAKQPSSPVLMNSRCVQRELAYLPSIPKGWNAPSVCLPKDLYVPKEIPLKSYVSPPTSCQPTSLASNTIAPGYNQPWEPVNYQSNTQHVISNRFSEKQKIFKSDNSITPYYAYNKNSTDYVPSTGYLPFIQSKKPISVPFVPSMKNCNECDFNNTAKGWCSSTRPMSNHSEILPYSDF